MAAEGGTRGSSSPSFTPINRSEVGDELLLAVLLDLEGRGAAWMLLLLLWPPLLLPVACLT